MNASGTHLSTKVAVTRSFYIGIRDIPSISVRFFFAAACSDLQFVYMMGGSDVGLQMGDLHFPIGKADPGEQRPLREVAAVDLCLQAPLPSAGHWRDASRTLSVPETFSWLAGYNARNRPTFRPDGGAATDLEHSLPTCEAFACAESESSLAWVLASKGETRRLWSRRRC